MKFKPGDIIIRIPCQTKRLVISQEEAIKLSPRIVTNMPLYMKLLEHDQATNDIQCTSRLEYYKLVRKNTFLKRRRLPG